MGETADMTPIEAARVLAQARDYESDLRERTQGVTWMVWGIATPAIFLTMAFAAVVGAPAWAYNVLWIPWVGAGYLTTWALWRSAAIHMPRLDAQSWPRILLRILLVSAAYMLFFMIFPIDGPAGALIAVGGAWTVMGVVNPYRTTTRNTRVTIAAGVLIAALGIGLQLARLPIEVESTTSLVASGLVPLAAGLYLTARG